MFWRLLDSNRSSADGLAWYTTNSRQWCRWTGSVRERLWSSGRSSRVAPSPLLYFLALDALVRGLRDEWASPALCSIPFAGPIKTKVSAFVDDIAVYRFHRRDIKAVKKAVAEYERIARTKVNFDKNKRLRLGALMDSNTLQGTFPRVTVPSASLECGSGPTSNWCEIGWKYRPRYYLPTPPLGQDMTQGQFLSRV